MGQTITKDQKQQLPSNDFQCTFIAARDNHIVVSANNVLLCQYDYSYPTEAELTNAASRFEAGRNLENPHIQSLLHVDAKCINTFCSAIYRLSVFYEYCEQTLLSEIITRREEGTRYFEQKELWSILCSCTLAFSYLQSQNVYYSGLTLQDIWLTESGVIKVNHPLNLTNNDPFIFHEDYFYAPEQLRPPQNTVHLNHHKSEVYQLGLVLLRCCNLEDERSFYDGDMVSQNVIGEMLLKAATKYDESFINTLITILKERPEERPRWNELENVIVNSVADMNRKRSQSVLAQVAFRECSPAQALHLPEAPHETSCTVHVNSIPADALVEEPEEASQLCETAPQSEVQTVDEVHSRIANEAQHTNTGILTAQSQNTETAKVSAHKVQNSRHSSALNTLKASSKCNAQPASNSGYKQHASQSSPSCFEPASTGRKSSPRVLSQSIKDQRGRYEGQTQNGMRHGYGTFYYSEGGIYTGEWVKGEMHGKGAIYYPSGKMAYEGEWSHDKLHGKGTLYNEEIVKLSHKFDHRDFGQLADYWVKYEGGFENDNKSGRGKLVLSNGQYFVGEFKDDEIDGKGRFYRTDGTIIKGIWRSNALQ